MNRHRQKREEPCLEHTSLYLEDSFYDQAETLRSQFESQVLTATGTSAGMTPFLYAFCQNAYQLLTASADRIFAPDILADLIAKLDAWGHHTLGTSHVSTPQARVYIHGCSRNLLRDDVAVPWHYVLSLTRNSRNGNASDFRVLDSSGTQDASNNFPIEQVMNFRLRFNQLLVHKASSLYCVEPAGTSMNPIDGVVFLDGYLW